ncbi:MAG: ATP-grasp domain-containing protein [Candidatus Omnitrophota bacterium]|nr:MAG: ATP-grasp domain-containing protein [Candidatus Omnitrophota bacterium]
MRKKLKVLLVFDSPYSVPQGYDFKKEFKDVDWDTERQVYKALCEIGHRVTMMGLYNDISILFEEVKNNKPDVVFNLAEVFTQKSHFDKNVAWLLEMLGIPYTGGTPASLLICNNKAISKEILSYHRIKVPHFHTFYRDHRIWLPKRLKLPLIVKPLCEEASRGISQASVVDNEEAFIERVKFIHQSMNSDAIAEEYIEGRELYVSIMGNKRLKIFPLREMKFGGFGEDEPRIATYKAKWDYDYRKRWEIKNVFAGRLPNGINVKIEEICKRAYRVLNMRCYGRLDIRVTPDSRVYILEANANPSLDIDDEFAVSAAKAGLPFKKLIQKLIKLAFGKEQL